MLWETGPPGLAQTCQAHGSLGAGGLHGPTPSTFRGKTVQNLRVKHSAALSAAGLHLTRHQEKPNTPYVQTGR